jgi:hypothetical protein
MTVNVYWTRSNPGWEDLQKLGFSSSTYMSPMRIEEPISLTKHLDYKNFFGPLVSKCPAVIDDLKNTFVIKSPVDLTLYIENNSFKIDHQELDFAQSFIGEPQGKFGIHQLSFCYNFFSEKSLTITQLPAFYDSNSFTNNTFSISGSFDIGRWYRPSGKPAFIIRPDTKKITIKQGDALLYIKFNTADKIKLIEFDDSEFLSMKERSPEWICGTLKRHTNSIISLSKCYEIFDQYKMRRRVMKTIKNNLI